jgi:hypothetical protein
VKAGKGKKSKQGIEKRLRKFFADYKFLPGLVNKARPSSLISPWVAEMREYLLC